MAEPVVINRIMDRLNHRGPDGSDIISAGNITMGHWHFWTTPEEVGERQPIELNDLPFKIVLDGRLDNRTELFEKLRIEPAEGKSLSDAALILKAYAFWGKECLTHFLGEYALVIFDRHQDELLCARDALGDRTLFYSFLGTRLVVASEPWAVAAAYSTPPGLNEKTVAHYFAISTPEGGQTFFNNIQELLPAHLLTVKASEHHFERYWQPDPSKKLRGKSDVEYAEQFRSLLEESIRCRMRSSFPVGVLMSGGLDSTSVACLTARMLGSKKLTTISYVFDELSECDERQYIEAVKQTWKINSVQIPCDDAWTFKDWENWPRNPNRPGGNIYRLLKERVYQRAQEEGTCVLLTGYAGDALYGAGTDWIADLVVDGYFTTAAKELYYQVYGMGWKKMLAAAHFRRIIRRIFDSISPGVMRPPVFRKRHVPAWLNPASASLTDDKITHSLNPVFERHGMLLTSASAQDISHEIRNTSRFGIELRNPYRDRRLIEYVLTLPAYQLYYHGLYKHVLRTAMKGILPESIRTRLRPTSFVSLYHRGLEREKALLSDFFQCSQISWEKYVSKDWLLKHWNDLTSKGEGIDALLPFLCIAYDQWSKSFVLEV